MEGVSGQRRAVARLLSGDLAHAINADERNVSNPPETLKSAISFCWSEDADPQKRSLRHAGIRKGGFAPKTYFAFAGLSRRFASAIQSAGVFLDMRIFSISTMDVRSVIEVLAKSEIDPIPCA